MSGSEKRTKRRLRLSGRRRLIRNRKIRRRIIRGLLILLLPALIGAYLFYAFHLRWRTEPRTRRTETNREAAVFRIEAGMRKMMSLRFPGLEKKIKRTYVIPGMKATRTIMGEFKAPTMCTSMTPQGMCVTEEYIFISAYCRTMKHSTVLYMLSREDGRLIKTIPLGMLTHAGGMAYDPVHRNVWVSGGTLGAAKAVGYSLADLEAHDESSSEPPTALYNYTLANMTHNSYMNYRNNQLLIGIFSRTGLSEVSWFDITAEGGLNARIFEDYDPDHESVAADHTAMTSGEIQGITIFGDRLALSKSYGPLDSVFQLYYYEPSGESYLIEDAVKRIKFPQKLEQICECDGEIYCIFESGAYCYRAQPLIQVDRILVFDAEELIGD